MKATRQEVYAAINGERAYQDAQGGNAATDGVECKAVGAGLVLMRHYLTLAEAAYSGPHPSGRDKALDIIRKVTALGVRVMEYHGAPLRT